MGGRFAMEGISEGGTLVGDIEKEEVPKSLISQYFGPKSSKSGWKYKVRTSIEEQQAIFSLYKKVYETEEMSNNELTQQFARALIFMSMGHKVDWCQFRNDRRQYREGLRKKKQVTTKQRSDRESVDCASIPSTIGKRRLTALVDRGDIDFPSELRLSLKTEHEGLGGSSTGKKVIGRSRGLVNSPAWLKEDLEMMTRVIEERSELVSNFERSLTESTIRSGELEDKLRRAKILRSDREEMVKEGKDELKKIIAEEMTLRAQIEERVRCTEEGQLDELSRKALRDSLLHDEAELEALQFRKACAERINRRSEAVVSDCDSTITILESEVGTSNTENQDWSHKVTSLKGLIVSMDAQLRQMEEGGGHSFFPRPILCSPTIPVTLTHTLNACPVCCLWYSSWDYIPAACGHCYHPWCLAVHTKISSRCLLSSCEKSLSISHKTALGIRPVAAVVSLVIPKDEVGKKKKVAIVEPVGAAELVDGTAATALDRPTISFVSSWSIESSDKEGQLSPSSQSNLISEKKPIVGSKGNATKILLCFMCNKKPPEVRLEKCGHAVFCFGCINGKKGCGFCFEKIIGWEPLPITKQSNLQLFCNDDASLQKISDPTCGSRKRKAIEELETGNIDLPLSSQIPAVEFSGSEDEDDQGLMHWCDEDVFSAGGSRSLPVDGIEVEKQSKKASPVMDAICEDSPQKSEFVVATVESSLENVEVLPECQQVFKRKKGVRRNSSFMNHTRIVEKKLDDILNSTPSAHGLEKATKKQSKLAESEVPNRRRGRPVAVSKTATPFSDQEPGLVRSAGRVKCVPARLKDM